MALEDVSAYRGGTDPIEGLIRIETAGWCRGRRRDLPGTGIDHRARGGLRQGGGAAGAARQLQRIRNGQIMSALLDVFGGILLALISFGVGNLQSWLERWDQERLNVANVDRVGADRRRAAPARRRLCSSSLRGPCPPSSEAPQSQTHRCRSQHGKSPPPEPCATHQFTHLCQES